MDLVDKTLVFIDDFVQRAQSLQKGDSLKPCGVQNPLEVFLTDLQMLSTQIETVMGELQQKNNPPEDHKKIDPSLVQIRADKAEIEKRITAFIQKKQMEVNDTNRREFCGVMQEDSAKESCARTNSVFTPHMGTKSHVKVVKVENKYGPQTHPHSLMRSPSKNQPSVKQEPPEVSREIKMERSDGVEERLSNMEKHLGMNQGCTVPRDVYERLKMLENRILELESTSPEYLHHKPSSAKRQKTEVEADSSYVQVSRCFFNR
ncbi:hypothetical protein CAPTEDRAFT_168929 [Capitella teleta]|uniref:MAP3K12-binding inhibitory protein 1 n=1 Tax=Capitella teleta TaxID=283909 RepID=R7UMQ4_CAPTE|nr:hypothetical protein CAPTEDRAFT_168929 [Capitella teleta]|eukprot:ELU04532.1 hypothetical protein CAPTEDRAFT_168929 [Capitella teleta]